jgi:hypothetical protein
VQSDKAKKFALRPSKIRPTSDAEFVEEASPLRGEWVWDATDQHAYIYAGAASGKTGSTLNDLWMVTS